MRLEYGQTVNQLGPYKRRLYSEEPLEASDEHCRPLPRPVRNQYVATFPAPTPAASATNLCGLREVRRQQVEIGLERHENSVSAEHTCEMQQMRPRNAFIALSPILQIVGSSHRDNFDLLLPHLSSNTDTA